MRMKFFIVLVLGVMVGICFGAASEAAEEPTARIRRR